ncbi:MAG: hypothetical protein E7C54_02590 [Clostridioides difficile]|uniref:hypothetical protein n=1 Tax=Clostridium perfringens TaxID=1502 RepID=UPI000DF0FC96|nr:hypothetical protein [Clostridium perfringens]ELC8387324.1 hypothetical protein [Clostridium perfringens]MDU2659777.1 hypothetical protein [Clostridioides difficile]STB45331.1 Uncharacterised protein [Clostridium perfringens]
MALALSKMHKRCKECKYKTICGNKRIVSCNIIETPQSTRINATFATDGQTLMRKYTPITIKIGEFSKIETSLEKISESLTKDLNKKLGIGVGLK